MHFLRHTSTTKAPQTRDLRLVFGVFGVFIFTSLFFFIHTSPVAAVDALVDATVFATNSNTVVSGPTAVWVSDDVGFVFYLGAEGDLEMSSTTDGGLTWALTNQVDSVNTTDVVSYAVWWDGWTEPGTTTQYIHIVTTDTGVDDTYYTRVDVTNGSKSTSVVATTQSAACTRGADCEVSITKTPNDVIYMTGKDGTDSWVVSCATDCTTAGNWSESTGAYGSSVDNGDDRPFLMPIPGTNNVLLTYWDISADTIDYNIYSATATAWTFTTTQQVASTKDDNTTYDGQLMGMALSTTTGYIALALVDDANDYTTQDHDINFYLYSSSTGWVAKTNPITNTQGGLTGVKVSYDPSTNTWYVIYTRRTTIGTATSASIYYRTSSDNGDTWSNELGPVNDIADDIYGLTTDITSAVRIGAWYNHTTAPRADDVYYTPIINNGSTRLRGTLYYDEGVSAVATPSTVRVAIGTSTVSIYETTTVPSTGAWEVIVPEGHLITAGTPIVAWLSGSTTYASVFTKAFDTNHIPVLNVYTNRVIVRHEATRGTTTRSTELGFYDGDDEPEIRYTANGGEVSVRSATQLYLWPSKTFEALGPVTVHGNGLASVFDGSFHLGETTSYLPFATTTLAGNFTASSSALFYPGFYTLLFNATTTGKQVSAPQASLGTVVLDGVGGSWTFATTTTLSALSLINGTVDGGVSLEATTLTVGAGTTFTAPTSLSVASTYENAGTFDAGVGTLYFSGARTTATGTLTGTSAMNDLTVTGPARFAGGDVSASLALTGIVEDTSSADYAYAITADTTTLYITGYCDGCGNRGSRAYHTIAYNKSDGSFLWSTTTDPTASADNANAVTQDATTLYVTGYCTGCGNRGLQAYHTIAYNKTDGSFLWSTTTDPAASSDVAYAITQDDTTLYLSGVCDGCGNRGAQAYHTIAYNKTDGSFLWSTTTDPMTTNDFATAITADENIVYVTGSCFACGALGGYAYHTIAYNKSDGSFLWSATTDSSTQTDSANGVVVDDKLLFVTGYCQGCGNVGGGSYAYLTVAYDKQTGALIDGYNRATLGAPATTSNLTILSGNGSATNTLALTNNLSVAGNYTNGGIFEAGIGTTTFNGTTAQTATGTLSGTSAFYNLAVTNNTATTSFGAPVAVTNHLALTTPDSAVAFQSSQTATIANLTITGTAGNEVRLRSSTPGTRFRIAVTGTYAITYADVMDSYACESVGGGLDVTDGTSIASGNTGCWFFLGGEAGDTITVSGVLYEDDGKIPASASQVVLLAIATSTPSLHSTTTMPATGAFSFSIPIAEDFNTPRQLTFFAPISEAVRGTTVTKATSTATLSELALYGNRLIVRNDSTDLFIENADLASYDNDNHASVPFTANAGSLSVHSPHQLFIATSTVFSSQGAVTIQGSGSSTSLTDGSLHLAPSATYTVSGTVSLAGSLTASSSATFDNTEGYSLYFTATTTGKSINLRATTLGSTTFSGVNGSWTFATSATTTNLTINTSATVNAPASTLVVQGTYTNAGTFGAGVGTLYFSGARTTATGTLTGTSAMNDLTVTGPARFAGGDASTTLPMTGLVADPTTSTDQASAITQDATALYVTGYCDGCGNRGSYAYHTIAYSKTNGSFLWSTTTDPTASSDYARAITADATTLYVTGYCTGCGNLGSTAYHTIAYNKSDGSFLWSTTTDPTASLDYAYAITADATTLYVTGICFGCGNRDAEAYHTIAYSKSDGSFLWSTTTDPTTSLDIANAITADDTAVYVTGYCNGCGNRGSTAYHTIVYNKSDGSFLWSTTTDPTASSDSAVDITADATTLYVTGSCNGCGNRGSTAYHTIAYNKQDGSFRWSTTTDPTASSDSAVDITADATTLYVTGYCDGCGNRGSYAYHTIAYSKTNGSFLWSTTTDPTASSDYANAITADATTLYVTGYCTGCGDGGSSAYLTLAYDKQTGALIDGFNRATIGAPATTSNLTILSGNGSATNTLALTNNLSVTGNYQNGGVFEAGSGTTDFTSASAQTIAGIATGTSTFSNLSFSGSGTKTFTTSFASTTNLTINTGATVVAPATTLSIAGNYTNNGTFTHNSGTVVLASTTKDQTLAGTMTGTSAFNHLDFIGTSSKLFYASASTTNLTIGSGATVTPQGTLTVAGNFLNNGSFYNPQGTLALDANSAQSLSGNLTHTSALGNVLLTGGNTKTFTNNASTTNLTIAAGTTVTAPTVLSVGGTYTNAGTFGAGAGTLHLAGARTTATGTLTGTSALNDVTVTGPARFAGGDASTTLPMTGLVADPSSSFDQAYAITADATTLYVTGYCTGCGNRGQAAYHTVSYNKSDGSFRWSTTTDPTASTDYANAITGDTTTFYVTGTCNGCGNRGQNAYHTIAHNKSDGSFRWSTTTDPTASGDNARAITSDITTLYITGSCGTGCGNRGGTAYHTIAYNKQDGSFLWATTTDPSPSTDNAYAITASETSLYVTGTCDGCGSRGGTAYHTIAYNKQDGSFLWATTTDPTASGDVAHAITADATTVYITGYCANGCGNLGFNAYHTIAYNKQDGSFLWSTTTDPTTSITGDSARAIIVDATSVYVTGSCDGCGSRGGTAYHTIAYNKTDASFLWSTTTDSTNSFDEGRAITQDDTTIYISGDCAGCGTQNSYAYLTVAYNKQTGALLDGYNRATVGAPATVADLTIVSGNGSATNTLALTNNLSVTDSYQNGGAFEAGGGTTTFSGASAQSIGGSLVGASAFGNVALTGAGVKTFSSAASTTNLSIQTTATTSFSGPLTVGGNLTITTPAAKLALAAGATTTVSGATTITGTAGNEVRLRSTEDDATFGIVFGEHDISYVDVKDSSGSTTLGTLIDASDGTSIDSLNNTGWDFGQPGESSELSSATNQTFALNGATTTISAITVTDALTPTITAASDLRLTIATTSVNMRWDTTDTTASFGGTAAAKVSTTVSYEGDGATLVLDVTENFIGGDTLIISGLSYTQFAAVNTATIALTLHIDGTGTGTPAGTDDKTVTITGSLTLANHPAGQADDGFTMPTNNDVILYRYTLTSSGEDSAVTDTVITLIGVQGIDAQDITNLRLYRDENSDGLYDGGDTLIDGSGTPAATNYQGTITFTADYTVTGTDSFLILADTTDTRPGDMLTLTTVTLTATGTTTNAVLTPVGTISTIQHLRGGVGGSSPIGGDAPAGHGIETGGGQGGGSEIDTNTGGDTLGNLPSFKAPAGESGSWTTGENGIDSDGSYATTSGLASHSYHTFGFNLPGNSIITGVEVKLEASATTNAGDLDVELSWDNGNTYTTPQTTDTLTNSDTVYTLGGEVDTWGHSWTVGETTDGTFLVRITGNPDTNAVQLDALRVRIHHYVGGGNEGGPIEVRRPGLLPLAGSDLFEAGLPAGLRRNLGYALGLLEVALQTYFERINYE